MIANLQKLNSLILPEYRVQDEGLGPTDGPLSKGLTAET